MTMHEQLDNGYPHVPGEPGHDVRILGAPKEDQMEAFIWALNSPFRLAYGSYLDIFTTAFDLPYSQGPGFTVIDFKAVDPRKYGWEEEKDIPAPYDDWDQNWWRLPIVVTFGYADSMTNIWSSPIYANKNAGDEDQFCLGAM